MPAQTKQKSAAKNVPVNVFTDRQYQTECLETIEKKGEGKYLIVLATGLGKTYIFTHMKRHGRTLILSHRDELVRQPERYYQGVCSFGVEKADEFSNGEDVVSASVQTLCKEARLARFSPDEFETVIIDEAHHAAAPSYQKILNYFSGAKRRLGFTATPKRGDGVGLADTFDEIIFVRDLKWGIKNNYLCGIQAREVVTDFSLKGITKTAGDYSQSQLDRIQKEGETLPAVARAYVDMCHKKGKHTLIYCVTKDICSILCDTIRKLLPKKDKEKICVLTGDTPDDERKAMLDSFSAGETRCIINCMVLTEGTDLPICDAIINLRATCNPSLYQQIIGRGTRLYDGKENCLVIDIVPEGRSVNRNICTAPTLFGIEPMLLDQETREKLEESNNLLEFCEELSSEFSATAKDIKFKIRAINLFVNERERIIEEHENTGVKQLAIDYLEFLDERREKESDYDFGSLDVVIQADEARYYKITPTWNTTIFISKPDVLGNVRVEFENIDRSFVQMDYCPTLSGSMKMKDAINLVRKYCELQQPYFRYAWDRSTQNFWRSKPLTDSQKSAVIGLFKNKDVSTNDVDELNKLEASKLIDMARSINNSKTAIATLKKEQNEDKIKRIKRVSEATEDDMTRTFNNAVLTVTEKYEKKVAKRQQEQLERQQSSNGNEYYYPISVRVYASARESASPKQKDFIKVLLFRAESSGNVLPEINLMNVNKRRASILIEFLMKIADDPMSVGVRRVFTNVSEVCDNFEKMESGSWTCKFRYKIEKPEEGEASHV